MTQHKIIFGDCRNMGLIPSKSVQLIVTSPPYWQIKDYGTDSQIGYNDTYEDYINNLNLVWQECERVLADGCRLCINIGDQFTRTSTYGRHKSLPIRAEIVHFCEQLGLDHMGSIIWSKVTNKKPSGGGAVMGSYPYPRNGIVKLDYEFILLFKKLGEAPKPTQEAKEQSAMTREEWNSYFCSDWHFAGAKQIEHIAMFPEELPRRLIKMFSFVGETILDPFMGSGTTALAARHLGRNSVGYEINDKFEDIIRAKVSEESLFDKDSSIEFAYDNNRDFSFSTLHCRFVDANKISKISNNL